MFYIFVKIKVDLMVSCNLDDCVIIFKGINIFDIQFFAGRKQKTWKVTLLEESRDANCKRQNFLGWLVHSSWDSS